MRVRTEGSKRWWAMSIDFPTEKEAEDFKNYMHNVKVSKGTPIYKTAQEMVELHRERYKK